MKRGIAGAVAAVMVGAVWLGFAKRTVAQSDLKVTYGSNGVQQLSYLGVVLEDLNAYPSDAFHIYHMKATDLQGNVLAGGQYGWGESNSGRAWNAGSQTMTYTFSWGSIAVQYAQTGNTLDMRVTEVNASGSGIIFDGASIYPLALHMPQLPVGFTDASYSQLSYTTTGPSVLVADYGAGEVVAVAPDASRPLYSGFQPAGNGVSYTALISGTTPDSLATFLPHFDRPVQPGQTDTFTVSLRFAPSGTPTGTLAADAYANWAKTWPMQLNWKDRRAIGTAYLASSPTGNANQPGGYPNNPRRYFNDSNASDFDVTTPAGLAKFQARVLSQAAANVQNLQHLGAQGAITWDIEGEQFPQSTSYVCAPDQIAQVAPEMESIIANPTSPYHGMKLDDAYFSIMRSAGFRVGVCIRPQHFTLNADGTASQVYLPDAAIPGELIRKMTFAHDRWGATLFYVDSTVEANGAVLDPSIFQQVGAALPDSLIIPEETVPKDYAYTAAFKSFIFLGATGTDSTVYNYYPQAFSAVLVNDVAPSKLSAALPQLTAAVKAGDILMGHIDYWQDNNPTIVQIYASAGSSATGNGGSGTPAPTQPAPPSPVTPSPAPVSPPSPSNTGAVRIVSPTAGESVSGTVTVTGQVNVSLDAAGSYLMVDGAEVGTARVSGAPYQYALDTAMLSNGTHVLQLWAHDTGNNTDLSQTVTVTVTNTVASGSGPTSGSGATPPPAPAPAPVTATAPITLTYPASGQAISGLVAVTATILQGLDAAGSYLMVDGAEFGWQRVDSAPFLYQLDTSTLSAGPHTLQIWAHTVANEVLLSNQAVVTVSH